MSEPVEYRLARLQEALTHDPRVLEQSLEVRVEGDRVILRGELVTPERCQAAIAVATVAKFEMPLIDRSSNCALTK